MSDEGYKLRVEAVAKDRDKWRDLAQDRLEGWEATTKELKIDKARIFELEEAHEGYRVNADAMMVNLRGIVSDICEHRELCECWYLRADADGDCGNWPTCNPDECSLAALRRMVGVVPQEDGGMDKQPSGEADAKDAEPLFYILSLKWTKRGEWAMTWWGPDGKGYTDDLDAAGTYTHAAIADNANHYNDGTDTLAVPCALAREHTETTRPVAPKCFVPNTKALTAQFRDAAKTITTTDAE